MRTYLGCVPSFPCQMVDVISSAADDLSSQERAGRRLPRSGLRITCSRMSQVGRAANFVAPIAGQEHNETRSFPRKET